MESQFLRQWYPRFRGAARLARRKLRAFDLESLGCALSLRSGRLQSMAWNLAFPGPGVLPRAGSATVMIIAAGGIVAAGGYLAINDYANTRLQHEFGRAAGEISSILARSFDRHVEIAESTATRFTGPNANVSRWAFFDFIRALPPENPGLSAVAWIPRVPQRMRGEFERKASADGLFDFHFLERAPGGRRVRASTRREYYPVYYVEPYPGNESMLGLDLAADSTFAEFLAQVRDTGKTSAAPGNVISGPDVDVPGFSVVVPVYRSNVAPFTAAERRKTLSGFIRADFRFDRLLESSWAGFAGLPALEVYILDRGEGNEASVLHFFSSRAVEGRNRVVSAKDAYRGVFTAVDHEVAGRKWSIVVKPVRGVFQNLLGFAAWGFVAFTLLLTGLLLRHIAAMRLGREQAEAANRAKSDFLAMMSHELRTPLNTVIGFSDVMINELFGPLGNAQYKTYSAHINRSATHLLGLINSILDLSRIEAGYFKLEKETFALRRIWDAVFPMLQESFRDSGVDLSENLSRSLLTLNADPRVFRQIIQNLVSNAIKFTPEGGKVSVTAGIGRDGRFTLRVTDTGIGIAKEDLDTVLMPFRQVDNSLSRKYEGVGLGLPLTRKLTELQGGVLEIDSRLGQGTDVIATFPKGIVVSGAVPHEKPPCAPRAGAAPSRPAAASKKKTAPKGKPGRKKKAPATGKAAASRR